MTGQRDFCKALLDPDQGTPDGLRSWNGSDPAMRFAVYRNNVIASLIEALADSFPVVKALVGDRFFDAMAQGFVRQNLPASPVLARYGDAFPAFVADFEPAGSLPYLADVARLEWFYVQAFHAADAQPVATEAIGRLLADSDALPGLRLGLHPSAALLCSDHAVVSIWAAHQGTGDLRRIDPGRPEQALLLRSGLEVQVLPLDRAGAHFTERLLRGESLGEALERTAAESPAFDPAGILGLLIRHGAITALHPST